MFFGSRYCHKCQKPISSLCRNITHLSSIEAYCCECWTQYQTENEGQNVFDYSAFDYESSGRVEKLMLAVEMTIIKHEEVTKDNENTQPNQNATQKEQGHCPICYEDRLEYALIECGHVVCGDCKPKLKECPICRADIRGTVRIYISK